MGVKFRTNIVWAGLSTTGKASFTHEKIIRQWVLGDIKGRADGLLGFAMGPSSKVASFREVALFSDMKCIQPLPMLRPMRSFPNTHFFSFSGEKGLVSARSFSRPTLVIVAHQSTFNVPSSTTANEWMAAALPFVRMGGRVLVLSLCTTPAYSYLPQALALLPTPYLPASLLIAATRLGLLPPGFDAAASLAKNTAGVPFSSPSPPSTSSHPYPRQMDTTDNPAVSTAAPSPAPASAPYFLAPRGGRIQSADARPLAHVVANARARAAPPTGLYSSPRGLTGGMAKAEYMSTKKRWWWPGDDAARWVASAPAGVYRAPGRASIATYRAPGRASIATRASSPAPITASTLVPSTSPPTASSTAPSASAAPSASPPHDGLSSPAMPSPSSVPHATTRPAGTSVEVAHSDAAASAVSVPHVHSSDPASLLEGRWAPSSSSPNSLAGGGVPPPLVRAVAHAVASAKAPIAIARHSDCSPPSAAAPGSPTPSHSTSTSASASPPSTTTTLASSSSSSSTTHPPLVHLLTNAALSSSQFPLRATATISSGVGKFAAYLQRKDEVNVTIRGLLGGPLGDRLKAPKRSLMMLGHDDERDSPSLLGGAGGSVSDGVAAQGGGGGGERAAPAARSGGALDEENHTGSHTAPQAPGKGGVRVVLKAWTDEESGGTRGGVHTGRREAGGGGSARLGGVQVFDSAVGFGYVTTAAAEELVLSMGNPVPSVVHVNLVNTSGSICWRSSGRITAAEAGVLASKEVFDYLSGAGRGREKVLAQSRLHAEKASMTFTVGGVV